MPGSTPKSPRLVPDLGRMFLAALSALCTFAVITCLFAVIHKMLPDAPLSWRDAGVGALGTALLFSLGDWALAAYLRGGAAASSYGAAGSLAALLLWVHYSARIFFLGAAFSRIYALGRGSLRHR